VKIILAFFLSFIISFGSSIQEDIWWKGESLITFLDKHHISKEIYFNLSKTDKELCSEIYAGVKYQILYDENKKPIQILIPISEQMQIYIFTNSKGMYALDIIPIEYQETTTIMSVPIKYSPYQDIISTTNNKNLANEHDYHRVQLDVSVKY